jgi:hypothetical protein
MMKHFTLITAGVLAAGALSAQKGQGRISAELPANSINISQVLTEKTDTTIFLNPASFQDTACQNVALWTFNVPNPDTSVGGTLPGGFIFGLNAFRDNQKGYMFNGTGTVAGAGAFYGFKGLVDTASTGGVYQAHVLTSDGSGGWVIAGSSIPTPYASIDTSLSGGPQPTPFVFNPAVAVSGDFIVLFDVFSQADTSGGAAIWANGPACGTDRSYERWLNQGGTYSVVKISSEWNGPGGNPLLADPYVGIALQTTTGLQNLTPNSLMAYPNPANASVNVSFGVENDIMGRIEVRNLAGQLVLASENQFYAGKNTIELNVNELANGIYVYRVFAGDSEMNGKLVVTH